MNKKGMELSINFIVILIITLIVFGGCLYIAANLFKNIDKLKDQMDKQTQDRLESMITSGNEEVVIAFNKKEVKIGDAAIFGIGVLNTLGSQAEFSITIQPSQAFDIKGQQLPNFGPSDKGGWRYLASDNIGSIENHDYKTRSIVLITSANPVQGATYIFDVQVYYKTTPTSTPTPYPLGASSVKKIRVSII